MNVLKKNILGQYVQKDYDNKLLLHKGLYKCSDETVAGTLSMSLPEYKRAVEELVYRHITCKFSSKDLLMKSLSMSENEIDDICKRIHDEVTRSGPANSEIEELKEKVRRMERRMNYLEDKLYDYEMDEYESRTPRHRERYHSPCAKTRRRRRSRRYDDYQPSRQHTSSRKKYYPDTSDWD